jgi:membrane-associated phospholipid phosphatase
MTAADERESGQPVLRRCLNNVETALRMLTRPARSGLDRPWPVDWQQIGVGAAVALVILLLGMLALDGPMIRAVGHLPRFVIWFFQQITDFGKSGWFLWPLGILFLGIAALPAMLPRVQQMVLAAIAVRVGFLFVAIGAPSLFDTIIKRMIGRARPYVGGALDPTLFHPFIWRADYASLPSGHVTTAFAVLVAFGTLWPRARTALWIYALLIAASRIVVTAHYPTDVLAGAVVGTVGALMARRWFALRGLGFSLGPDGALHQRPGPSAKRIKAVARGLLSE